MAQAPQPRQFEINPTGAEVPPLLLGFMGPPGGGKTKSALRVADGIARVRGGKPLLIDTEAGRALKYRRGPHNPQGHDFDYIRFSPPFVPADFLAAIKQALRRNPAAIIIDSMSDEHEGEGGVLDWHDAEVPKMGGNEWAAWSKPKASRRALIAGIQQIDTPLIFTFRAREKTVTKQGSRTPVNIGYMPIAPSEIVHTLDLTCLLPPRANGVPLWDSPKEGEDFVIKLPEFLVPYIVKGAVLNEELGEALARWQAGDGAKAAATDATGNGGPKPQRTPEQLTDSYIAGLAAPPEGRVASLDDLQAYQLEPRTAAWVEKMRKTRPDLHDRIVTANSRRARELVPPDDDETPEARDYPEHGDDDLQPMDERQGDSLFDRGGDEEG